ncbi:MAG: hypothetical protein KIT16_17045 [Rhodospirillaceae bacterium]|nr:hypothetical protein [Rhodospirillaceae bacterium]
MRGFNQIPSLIQVWIAQFVVLIFFAEPVVRLYQLLFRPKTGIVATKFGWFDLLPWGVGLLCLVWLMRSIYAPRLGSVRWVPAFSAGPAVVWNGAGAASYTFTSTHPSYVFTDALAAGFAFFIFWAWNAAWQERRIEAYIILALGLLTPVSRLFAWYVLGLKPRPPAPGPEAQRYTDRVLAQGWRPVFAFYAVSIPILVVAGGLGWIYSARDARNRIASAIVIDPAALAGGRYFEDIRDRSNSYMAQSRLARIRIAAAGAAQRCVHATNKNVVHFNLRTELGPAGDTMLVLQPEAMRALERRLAAAGGTPVDLLGVLVRPPRPEAIPSWRQHVYCSLPGAARQPRWIFEVEEVLRR